MRLRGLAVLATLGAFVTSVVVLSLSDRAPRLVPRAVDLVMYWGRRFESTLDIDLFDVSEIPGRTDQIGHAIMWGSGMLVIGYLFRHQVPVLATACLLLAASIGMEFLQATATATRALEATDALANGVGIAMATAAVIVVSTTVDAFGRLRTLILRTS